MAVLLVIVRPVEGKGDHWKVSVSNGRETACKSQGSALGVVKVLAFRYRAMLVLTYSRRDQLEGLYAFKSGRWRKIPLLC